MAERIRWVAILHLIYSGVGLLLGLFFGVFLGGIGILFTSGSNPENPQGAAFLSLLTAGLGAALALFFLVTSLPGIIAAVGLLRYRSWARVMMIVLSILDLIFFPIGTALGVFSLVVLFSPEAEQVCSGDGIVVRQ